MKFIYKYNNEYKAFDTYNTKLPSDDSEEYKEFRRQILDWYYSDDKKILKYLHSGNPLEDIVNELFWGFLRRYRLSDLFENLPQENISKEDTYPQWVVSGVESNVMEKIFYQDDYNDIINDTEEDSNYKAGFERLKHLFSDVNDDEDGSEPIGLPETIENLNVYLEKQPYARVLGPHN